MASQTPSEQEPHTPSETEDEAGTETENSEFSQAFAERAGGAEPPAPDPEPAKAEPEQTGDDSTDGTDQAPSQAAGDEPPAQPGSQVDPWQGLSPEQKAYFERLRHSEVSQRGRVASLTRKLEGRQEQAPAAPPPPPAPAATAPAAESQPEAKDLDARLKQAVEDYPDAVGPLADVIAEIRERIGGLETKVDPITEKADDAAMAAEFAKLEELHPDYREIGADPSWDAWLKDQPQPVQQLGSSYDAKNVSLAISLFKAERAAAIQRLNPPAENTTDTDPKPNATDARRERQLDASRQVPGKGGPAAGGVPDDFSAAFHARVQQQEAQAKR